MANKRKSDKRSPPDGPPRSGSSEMRARKRPGGEEWELVHPRCALDRADDLDEVQTMIDGGESEIARDELRWLLSGCSDCLVAHKMLGELALSENDLRLARGHFGYAFEIGAKAFEQAGARGTALYRLPANEAFFEAGKGLVYCLRELGKRDLAAEVVARLLALDPSDPLAVQKLLEATSPGACGEPPPSGAESSSAD